MRSQIIAGNWKMNTSLDEGLQLAGSLMHHLNDLDEGQSVILFPPYTHLQAISQLIHDQGAGLPVHLGAQNCHPEPNGAYTGEVSAVMLSQLNVEYVLVGHSERRQYFNEDSALLAGKIDAVLAAGLKVIYCCGESLDIRNAGTQTDLIKDQFVKSVFHLSEESITDILIAYEPVWAIGTGDAATPEQAQEMHAFIRQMVADQYNNEVANDLTILYGGSCNKDNAAGFLQQSDIDGALVGSASLNSDDFSKIIASLPK